MVWRCVSFWFICNCNTFPRLHLINEVILIIIAHAQQNHFPHAPKEPSLNNSSTDPFPSHPALISLNLISVLNPLHTSVCWLQTNRWYIYRQMVKFLTLYTFCINEGNGKHLSKTDFLWMKTWWREKRSRRDDDVDFVTTPRIKPSKSLWITIRHFMNTDGLAVLIIYTDRKTDNYKQNG